MSSPGENERTYPAQNLCKRVTIYDDEQELENLLPDPSGFAAEAGMQFSSNFVSIVRFEDSHIQLCADCENSIDDVGVPASSTWQAARTSNRTSTFLFHPKYWCCKLTLLVVLCICAAATQGIESSPGTILHNPRLNAHRRFIFAPVQKLPFIFPRSA